MHNSTRNFTVLDKNANSRTALWRTVSGTKLRLLRNTNSSIWNPLNCKLSVLFPIDQSFPEGKFGRWKCKLGRIGPSSKRKRLGSVHKWRLLYRGGGGQKMKKRYGYRTSHHVEVALILFEEMMSKIQSLSTCFMNGPYHVNVR